jgi:hypothetical protein
LGEEAQGVEGRRERDETQLVGSSWALRVGLGSVRSYANANTHSNTHINTHINTYTSRAN